MTDYELKAWVEKFMKTTKRYGKSISATKYEEIRTVILERTKRIDELQKRTSWLERMYWIIHDMYDFNKCPICGNYCLLFGSAKTGDRNAYSTYCSNKCVGKSKVSQDKRIATYKEKYGEDVINPGQLTVTKASIEETCLKRWGHKSHNSNEEVKATKRKVCKERYGEDNPLKVKEFRNKGIETMLKKFGVKHPMHSVQIIEQMRINCLEKHGVDWYVKTDFFRIKLRLRNRIKYLDKRFENLSNKFIEPLFTKEEYIANPLQDTWKYKCLKCSDYEFEKTSSNLGVFCPKCWETLSAKEYSLFKWLKSILPNSKIERHNKTILDGKEVDIFIPEYNLAIEFDGLYWHAIDQEDDFKWASEKVTNKNVHLWKTERAAEKGVKLIHVFENEWDSKKDVVKSIIMRQLNLLDKCILINSKVVKLDWQEYKNFVEKYSLETYKKASFRFGIVDNLSNELIAILGLDKARKSQNNYEVSNIAIANYKNIEKTWMDYICASNKLTNVTLFADHRYFSADDFKETKFQFITKNIPVHWYFFKGSSKFGYKYQGLESKRKYELKYLPKLLNTFDPNLSEWENMKANGYSKIYDCGKLKLTRT